MCGIVGSYNISDPKLTKSMADRIAHRGPDGEGFYHTDFGSLGVRRLAIIDVKGGDMPISNEDGSSWIVYNGEIYNYKKLTEELKALGHTFKTESDTEMVLHAYEQWGQDAVKKFSGMFAFAIINSQKREIFVARDQFGIKPFYYFQHEEKFIFSSEIKAFLAYDKFTPMTNELAIYKYLAFRKHDDINETFFKGVFRLMPGECGLFSEGKFTRAQYYSLEPSFGGEKLSEKELITTFKELFVGSVQAHLMSEVPVGTCLSGGIDSSSIVCVINNLLKKSGVSALGDKQKTFSAIFPNQINNEEEYIKEVLKVTNTTPFTISPVGQELFNELEKFVYFQEEPLISSGPYAQWCVMREASKHVKVLLDGQGADELLAGYTPYFVVYLRQLLNAGQVLKFLREVIGSSQVVRGLLVEKIKLWFSKVSQKTLVSKEFSSQFNFSYHLVKDNLKERLKQDLFEESIPALLRYEDKNSMAFSVEGRVPFLDTKLVEFIFSLPDELLIKNGINKFILREAMRDLLPEKVVKRRWKVGFTTPEVSWFRDNKEEVLKILKSDSFRGRKYFNHLEVDKFVSSFYQGKHNESMVIWRLINLEMWLRIYIDNRGL